MPYRLAKVDGYKVTSPNRTHAKKTSYQKAMAQMSLLRGIEHGWSPTGKKKARRYKKKRLIGR